MKRILLAVAGVIIGASASAEGVNMSRVMNQINAQLVKVQPMGHFTPGDTCNYNLSVMGMTGTMTMSVKSVGPEGVWIDQAISLMGQNQDEQELIDPASGKVIKVIVNGQEQAPPDPNDVQIISEQKADVTVPAGTFHTIDVKVHIKSQNADQEMWIDPTNVPVAGLVKLGATAQGGIPITGELTKVTHGSGLR
jgi:hypothetical protein